MEMIRLAIAICMAIAKERVWSFLYLTTRYRTMKFNTSPNITTRLMYGARSTLEVINIGGGRALAVLIVLAAQVRLALVSSSIPEPEDSISSGSLTVLPVCLFFLR